jgi:drug/metabolite transporter (DMT)-like permease
MPRLPAWLALAYLTVMGSVVAYTAYVYLLKTVRPALATSYAYVNPVVAVFLGLTLGGESITGPVWVALPLILIGVGLAVTARHRPARYRSPVAAPRLRIPAKDAV